MGSRKIKCPRCGSDYLEQKPLRFSDLIVSFISNDRILHLLCLGCLRECRAHLPKFKHRATEAGV